MTSAATRRERQRTQTLDEIKQRAWALMASSGHDALSLREVARQMGMAPSALYRYYPSRNDLLTALIIDAYDSLAAAVRDEYDRASEVGPTAFDTFMAVCRRYRGWALEHQVPWALIFSTSIPDYNGTEQTTAAYKRVVHTLTRIMADAVAEGCVDVDRLERELDDELRPGLEVWSHNGGFDLPAGALAGALWCYAVLHGCIALHLNDHLPPMLDNDALFDSALRAILAQLAG